MMLFPYIVLLSARVVCSLQYTRNSECLRQSEPSLNHINFIATLAGRYGRSELLTGNETLPTDHTVDIYPVTTDFAQWPRAGALFAEERKADVVVRRSLYITVEQDNGNTIMFYPYNFTRAMDDLFDKSQLSCILPTDLDYTHKCDRVVKPSTTQSNAFNFVSWPYCTGNKENPPIFSAVLTCDTIKVSFTKMNQLSSRQEQQIQHFVLTKTERVSLPQIYLRNLGSYRNPCN